MNAPATCRRAEACNERARRPNIMIVGVGGQGVIMVSKVLAALCQMQGLQVKQSEVHGMAKRGGIVFSHVRFGKEVWSPTIPHGDADILVALEWAEGLRWLDHCKPGSGTFIADTQQIVPPFAFRDRRPGARSDYAPGAPPAIIDMVGTRLCARCDAHGGRARQRARRQHRAAGRAVDRARPPNSRPGSA